RTIASTIVGEGLDTILFIGIAFWGTMPKASLIQMMLAQYLFKVAYEVAFTPLTYLVVGYIKRKENIDTFDRDVVYNPFRLGE
ncbi:MAG TPA: VUT family protein, partial [Rectinema sp.]|nr:VUT family protein [Rectinema sp.]